MKLLNEQSVFCLPGSREFTSATTLITLVVSILLVDIGNAEVVWRSKLYMATQERGRYVENESREFGCDDVIYLFYESADQSLATAPFEVIWRHTGNKMTHKTKQGFKPKSKGGRLWSWSGIEFNSGQSTLDKLTAFLDPVAGREQFIGNWDVTVLLSGKELKKLDMKVLC
ncbi:MAG: hypothetical protein KTR18_04280 [Acidiferrobacterales bacterium]|nr:hypothetical protein [Acidiferrobacterales bacterium]